MNREAERRMHYFAMLRYDEQKTAVKRMAASGVSEYTIAAATALSVEMIRKIIADNPSLQAAQ